MFKELGNVMSLMKNLPKLQASMAEMQSKLGQISVDGNAGAGMVVISANGRMELTKCEISEEAGNLGDRAMLADLIVAAANMALGKAREEVAKASAAMAQEAGLPIAPGMIPGF